MARYPWELRPHPHVGQVWTPIASLALRAVDGRLYAVTFLIDTGAAFSLLRRRVGDILGVSVPTGKPVPVRGIGGGVTQAYLHELAVELDGRDVRVTFAIAEHDDVPNLLGRFTGIDRIDIRLDRKARVTHLNYAP